MDSNVITAEFHVFDMAISPDGRYVAAGGIMSGLRRSIWDARNKTLVKTIRTPKERYSGTPESLAFSPDGKLLAVAVSMGLDSECSSVELWDASTWTLHDELQSPVFLHPDRKMGEAKSVAFSADGRYVVAASAAPEGGGVDVWEVASRRLLRTLTPEGRRSTTVKAVAISPDSKQVAGAMPVDDEVQIWDLPSGRPVKTLARGPGGRIEGMQYSPDGRQLAVLINQDAGQIANDGFVHVWDVERAVQVRSFNPEPGRMLWGMAYSPDGKLLAMGGRGRIVHLFDTESGKEISRLEGHPDEVYAIAFAPDGSYLAVGGGRYVKLWPLRR